jgi:SAM-dependent methyltransferase
LNSNNQADYNPFAALYNKHWGNSAERFLEILISLTGNQISEGSRVLDLCCGTGQLASLLEEKGHPVTGIDCSSGMLSYAKKNSPNSIFLLHDAKDFNLPSTFDLAVSTYDSLNHMMNEEDLLLVFQNVNRALKPGGHFLFDLNMENGFIQNWNGPLNVIEDDQVCAIQTQYKKEDRIAEFNVTLMSKENETWTRKDFQLLQKCYDESVITRLLKSAGFTTIHIHAVDDNKNTRTFEENDKRAFFLAANPS